MKRQVRLGQFHFRAPLGNAQGWLSSTYIDEKTNDCALQPPSCGFSDFCFFLVLNPCISIYGASVTRYEFQFFLVRQKANAHVSMFRRTLKISRWPILIQSPPLRRTSYAGCSCGIRNQVVGTKCFSFRFLFRSTNKSFIPVQLQNEKNKGS